MTFVLASSRESPLLLISHCARDSAVLPAHIAWGPRREARGAEHKTCGTGQSCHTIMSAVMYIPKSAMAGDMYVLHRTCRHCTLSR